MYQTTLISLSQNLGRPSGAGAPIRRVSNINAQNSANSFTFDNLSAPSLLLNLPLFANSLYTISCTFGHLANSNSQLSHLIIHFEMFP